MSNNTIIASLIASEEGFCVVKVILELRECNKTIFLLLDTGSSHSVISSDLIERGPSMVSFRFYGHNVIHHHKFKLIEKFNFPILKDLIISGVLGTDFLSQNKFIIDFGNNIISNSSANYNKKKMSFFYPIKRNHNFFILPLIGIRIEDDTYACLVDSGSNHNVISVDLVPNTTKHSKEESENVLIQNCNSTLFANSYNTKIYIASLENNYVKYHPVNIPVAITDTTKFNHSFFKSRILKGLLGYPFLREHNWIIDFSQLIMTAAC